MRLQSDLLDLIEAALNGDLDKVQAQWDPRSSLGVVMAARPYPEAPITGEIISGLEALPANVKVFHAGTALDVAGRVITAGGRVLCVTSLGSNVSEAQRHAYGGVASLHWANAFQRSDIGWRAIMRSTLYVERPWPCVTQEQNRFVSYRTLERLAHERALASNTTLSSGALWTVSDVVSHC